MGALITWVVTNIFADGLLKYIATKALLVTLFIVIVPILLNNFVYDLLEICINSMNSVSGETNLSASLSFSGLMAHFAYLLKLPESISVLSSAMLLRVTLNFIPFLRV